MPPPVETFKEIKKRLNYKVQSLDSAHDKSCESCRNFYAASPYKNRCEIIGVDLKNKAASINLRGICDDFKPWQ